MRIPRIVSCLLWAATAFAAVGWALQWPVHSAASAPPVSDSALPSIDRAAVQQLFALAGSSATPSARPVHAGSSTLQLDGIVFSSQAQHSRAIVQLAPGQVQAFAVGSSLPDGRRVQAIGPRHVELEQHGQTQTLQLPRQP